MRKVAVIDIGSNSIKLLVARRGTNCGRVKLVHEQTVEARIGAGISQIEPLLSPAGMAGGLAAIHELLAAATIHAPEQTILVATSAVRDARNGPEFIDLIRRETGLTVRLLSGDEEARAIGLGLSCDPALAELKNFYVFDLGGGSLECLAFAQQQLTQAQSLPLGCVRLTELFMPEPNGPFPPASRARLTAHVHSALTQAGFRFSLAQPCGVLTGGTATCLRAISATRAGTPLAESTSLITLRQMQAQLDHLAPLPLAQRKLIPGLPPARADVFPVALTTLVAVATLSGVETFHHSLFNLRYGIAKQALSAV